MCLQVDKIYNISAKLMEFRQGILRKKSYQIAREITNNTWVNPFAIRDVSMCTLVKRRVIQVSVPINDMAKE